MSQSNAQESLSRAVDLLGSARRKGIKLWSVNGQLHYKAPKGALSQEEIDKIRGSKRELIALLQKTVVTDDIEFTVRSDIRPEIVPLSFSQQAHWNEHRVYHLPDIRQIASATRLNGRLHIEVLRRSFDEMMRRHDALRTRIVHRDGVAVQQVGKLNDFVLELEDLTALPTQVQEKNVLRIIDELILQPIDVSVDLLFGARLIRLGQDEHVLIVVMEHMISDASSMGIFLHDLFAAYTQILRSEAVSLPDIPVQFADYAIWQQSTLNRFREKHESYWNERWAGCGRLRFPERKDIPAANRSGWECIPIHIDKDLKTELREWCRLRRTTMVMTIFAAYVGLVLRWCNAPKAVFVFQSDGRFSPKIEKAIGFFASALYLRIELHDEDTFVDLANQVAREYYQAYEHSDSCYMEAQLPRRHRGAD